MSWINNIETVVFTITTGDGKEWTPKWKNAVKDVDYNSSVFEFVNVEGSLVVRKKAKGRRFNLEFYFDGENAVDTGNNFELSSRDSRAWTIKHPFYGNFKCQPLTLKQDNSNLNVSIFNVSVIETISELYPKYTKIIEDEISSGVTSTNEAQSQSYDNSGELDKNDLANNVEYLDNTLSKTILTGEDLLEFKSLVADAVIEINNVTSTGLSIMRTIQALINYPATIQQTVQARFNTLQEAFLGIINLFDGNKHQFEVVSGSLISAMTLASTTNITDDYDIRKYVADQQDKLTIEYNRYIEFLDSLQTDRADSNDSYIPDFTGMNKLNSLFNLTIANLFNIAFGSKQEREHVLEKDSNIILLTHRFYGLDDQDENIDLFIKTNDIGLTEMLNIKKGRKILYYV